MSARRTRRLTSAAVALAIAVTAGACGSHDTTTSARDKTSKDSASAASANDANASNSASSRPESTAPSGSSSGSKKADAAAKSGSDAAKSSDASATKPTIDTSAFQSDYVFGSPKGISEDDPRPPNCAFKSGELCRMNVTGTYQLKTADVASIEVAAYEDGSTTASFATKLPNARRGSAQWHVDDFPYRARPGVKQVEILVRLLDASGKELARGKPTRYPVNG